MKTYTGIRYDAMAVVGMSMTSRASRSRGASRASGTSTIIHLSPLMAHARSKQETGHDDMTRNSSADSAVTAPVSKSKLARNMVRVASRKVRIHQT